MQILTEIYGSKWKSSYQMVGDSLFCTISVYDTDLNEWISRTDCGEKDAGISEEKSYATSAFKRAATQFGIGIELYSTPRIKFKAKDSWFFNDKLTMTFSVSKIEWDGDMLTQLIIIDRNGNKVYDFTEKDKPEPTEQEKFFHISNEELLIEFCKKTKPILDENMRQQLENFYRYWNPKCPNFTGKFDPLQLWKKWCERIK